MITNEYDLSRKEWEQLINDWILNETHRKTHGEPPAEMQAVYDYIHCKNIKKMEKAERIRAMYKR